jgi:RNA polymerase sigma factor (sigma-70 family)
MPDDLTTCTDQTLLARFVSGPQDGRQAAFAELVRRHAPMVVATCRRLVGTNADADDAAQAVFLTLAHKAREVGRHPTLAGWLHRVARNIGMRQRDALAARRRHETHQEARAMQSSGQGVTPPGSDELREVLDAGLDKLSERYRLPLVLHYLEGRSQEEVGALLQVPSGTLASLLSRGRDLLREQLGRQGVAVGSLAFSAWLASEVPAGLPGGFATATVAAASGIGTGAATLATGASPQAAALAQSTLAAMAKAKLFVAAAAAMLALGGLGGALPWIQRARPVSLAPSMPQANPQDEQGTRSPPLAAAIAVAPAAAADAAAEAAVWAVVRALRANDLLGLHLLGSPAQQAEVERAWRLGTAWTRADAAAVDRLLVLVSSEAGRRQMLPVAQGLLGHLPIARWLQESASRVQADAASTGAHASLTDDVVNAQRQTVVAVLSAFSLWLPQSGVDDPQHAAEAAACLLSGLAALGITHSADLARLDLPEALRRLGQLTAQIKRACAAYGLNIDQVLDSVRIIPSQPGQGDPARRILNVAFTAFDRPFVVPITVARSEGNWRVIPAQARDPARARPAQAGPTSEF